MEINQKTDKKIEKIIEKASHYMKDLNFEYIKSEIFKAYSYSYDAHDWQLRLSWEPYITHPVWATEILLDLKPDIYTIQACLLHDVIEDTPKTAEDIKQEFWEEVAFLCEWLAKLSKIRYKWEERTVWSLRKMLIAMAEDLRVIFIKLSDRLHNMRTLIHHPKKEKREKIALETLNLFSPIADRLGLHKIKDALNEECFKILDSNTYNILKKEIDDLRPQRETFIKTAKEEIINILNWEISDYDIDYRVKSIYSIYKKLLKKWLTHVSDLYDLFWIRIMVNTEAECYKVLWLVHKKLTPLPNRFKDYIALPKPNWYKSLHTSVIWLFKDDRKQPTEIQIKTFEMLEYSDIWVAAHFEYKEKWSEIATDIDWVKDLKELVDSIQDNDFVGSLKLDFFKDRIFAFTPKWDFIDLPAGSTPIDFAYAVHSDLWDHISIAKVNGSIHPLDKELRNWDVVEILTDKNKKPNPFRMSFVKTVKARNRIKLSLKKEDRELHRERWKEILWKYLEKFSMKIDKDLTILKSIDGKNLNMEERLSLLEQIWNFSLPPASVIRRLLRSNEPRQWDKKLKKQITSNNSSNEIEIHWKNLVIWWEEGLNYKFCPYCMKKKSWKDIVAHINNKWTITIHKRNCKVLDDVNKDRLLPAYIKWEQEESLVINVKLILKNKIWILKDVIDILYSMHIELNSVNSKKLSWTETEWNLDLKVLDYDYLLIDRFIERIKIKLNDLFVWVSVDEVRR